MVAPDDVQKRIDRMNCMLMKDISEAYSSIGCRLEDCDWEYIPNGFWSDGRHSGLLFEKCIDSSYSLIIGNDLSIVRGSSPVYIDEAPEVVVEKVDKILDKLQSVMEAMDYEYLARSGVTE